MFKLLEINKFIVSFVIIKASVMTSTDVHLTSISPKLVRSQPLSSQHPVEQQMTNDASHYHQQHVHVPRRQPDVNEHKENDDRLTSTSVFPLSTHTFNETEHIPNKNERKYSIPQTTATTTRDEKFSIAEEMATSSSLSSNRIITTNDVQTDKNELSSFNHNIGSNTTITGSHSISSDVSSPNRCFIPSSFDQQSYAYGNDESLLGTTSSSLLMHEQANHAKDKYLENKNQTSISRIHKTNEQNKSLILFLVGILKRTYFFFSRYITYSFFVSNSIKRTTKTDRQDFAFRRHFIITS